jgi:hypothetical protein
VDRTAGHPPAPGVVAGKHAESPASDRVDQPEIGSALKPAFLDGFSSMKVAYNSPIFRVSEARRIVMLAGAVR